MASRLVFAKTADRNRGALRKRSEKRNGVLCRRPFELALIRFEEAPAHRRIIEVLAARSLDQRSAGRDHRKPDIEVTIALPPRTWNSTRRSARGSNSNALAAFTMRTDLERPQTQRASHFEPR
jgi:hypothetical protein